MTYEQFKSEVTSGLKGELSSDIEILIHTVEKNNGIKTDKITIKDSNTNAGPSYDFYRYYEKYLNGQPLELIIKKIISDYEDHKVNVNIDLDFFMDFELAKHNIVYKVVNTELNKELLSRVPHVEYLDLSIVFLCLAQGIFGRNGLNSVLIDNEHMKLWGVTKEQLYELAIDNTPKALGCRIEDLVSMLSKNNEHFKKEFLEVDYLPVYVLTNSYKAYGAGTLLYKDLLDTLACKFQRSLYIIPSSVHEIIIMPEYFGIRDDIEEMKRTIAYVNQKEVLQDEILSYSLYYYDKSEKKLSIIE